MSLKTERNGNVRTGDVEGRSALKKQRVQEQNATEYEEELNYWLSRQPKAMTEEEFCEQHPCNWSSLKRNG